jgi:hypothetical protein
MAHGVRRVIRTISAWSTDGLVRYITLAGFTLNGGDHHTRRTPPSNGRRSLLDS